MWDWKAKKRKGRFVPEFDRSGVVESYRKVTKEMKRSKSTKKDAGPFFWSTDERCDTFERAGDVLPQNDRIPTKKQKTLQRCTNTGRARYTSQVRVCLDRVLWSVGFF